MSVVKLAIGPHLHRSPRCLFAAAQASSLAALTAVESTLKTLLLASSWRETLSRGRMARESCSLQGQGPEGAVWLREESCILHL